MMSLLRDGIAWFRAADPATAESANESIGESVSELGAKLVATIAWPSIPPRHLLLRMRKPASPARVREDILKMVTVEKFRGARFEPAPGLRDRTN